MDKKEGFELLKEIIEDELVHQDHKRVTLLADKYYKMKTGDGIEEMLHQIETRVTDEEFKQIKKIYKSIIPSTINATVMPFLKVTRTDPNKSIDFLDGADTKNSKLQKFIDTYWGDKSLDKYLEYAFVSYNYIDPNAFLITEFDIFDAKIENAKPYPFIASSKEAIMYEYRNEILKYLVVKLPIKYMDGDFEKDGVKYTMYLGWDTIVFSQAATGEKVANKFFDVRYFQPKNEKVPAIRFGYSRDEQTKGRTFVSIFHNEIGLLEKTLKIDSELDLSTAMVAFPQRYRYVTECKGGGDGCINGSTLNGAVCPVCNGTGAQPFHRGTQDIIKIAIPRNKEQMIDLEGLAYDHSPDIELLQFDVDYLKGLKETFYNQLFNIDRQLRSAVTVTATEYSGERDALNDTLYGFAQHYSSVWMFIVKDIATFTDLADGIILTHVFPKDFKLQSLQEMMADLQTANLAGASSSTVDAMQNDINKKLYADRPDDLKRMDVKNKFNPFAGYSEANIRFIVSQGNATKYNMILWNNYESIWQDLEFENEDPWIYDLSETLIREKVKVKTAEYMALIDGEKEEDMKKFESQEQPFVQ